MISLFVLLLLTACNKQDTEVMHVLAGSELKDLEPYLEQIRDATGVQLAFDYIGTLDGADRLMHDSRYDLAWFSHGKYIALTQEQAKSRLIVAQEKIMLSPVVMGIKRSVAARLGWDDKTPVTWRQMAEQASAGKLDFMMTDATASNSGFSALFGLLAAFSPNPAQPDFANVDQTLLQAFFKGNTGRSGSSGWLADRYVQEQQHFDGLVNYESVLLSLNQSGELQEPLLLLYPQEGIVTADYPLMLLKADKREAYNRLVTYLTSEAFQALIQEKTFRRPVNRKVKLASEFRSGLIELPFPGTLETVDQALFMFLDQNRVPSSSLFVLDVSGSMAGERIAQLRAAVTNLTGVDTTLSGKFARFRAREQLTLIPFSNQVRDEHSFAIHDVRQDSGDMMAIRNTVAGLEAQGGTAIYDALLRAYQDIDEQYRQDPQRYYTIVLMTDGQNNQGVDFTAWRSWWQSAPAYLKRVRVFPILFGSASNDEMEAIASTTGGRTFDARKQDLVQVFKAIRGYQ
ncbi:hypothetical protein WH50_02900 [Pokkaliibacter plantistimulans]|uniref:VWFA domain-containing protein n=2 Tax=Pokkaliibacter plantistimulans TaxID=1635171 RepID=A0ABX5M2L8_9GAMM|nr:hypothetical protein WH50_02900 [Pokkaliibacter plantistimulans]